MGKVPVEVLQIGGAGAAFRQNSMPALPAVSITLDHLLVDFHLSHDQVGSYPTFELLSNNEVLFLPGCRCSQNGQAPLLAYQVLDHGKADARGCVRHRRNAGIINSPFLFNWTMNFSPYRSLPTTRIILTWILSLSRTP
jgi:hypothetical protein